MLRGRGGWERGGQATTTATTTFPILSPPPRSLREVPDVPEEKGCPQGHAGALGG